MNESLFVGFTDELAKLAQAKKDTSAGILTEYFTHRMIETGLTKEVPEDVHRAASGEMAQGQDPNQ